MTTKLGEMILYIASKSQDDKAFGATKLNKILFTIDFNAFGAFGQSVSGATYIHRSRGPVPKELVPARRQLIETKRAVLQKRLYFGYQQDALIALEPANLSLFSDVEVGFMNDWIDNLKDFNGTELSNWTHRLRPWLDTDEGEIIPLFTVYGLLDLPASKEALKWGAGKLAELRTRGHIPD